MGSRLKTSELAYIAGFLDGDGSLMIQIKKRSDSKKGTRIMFTICFYQDTRHEKPLLWIRKTLSVGYISRRNDGMTELRINGYRTVESILSKLFPYLRFKKIQAEAILKSIQVLNKGLDDSGKKKLIKNILIVQSENYKSHKKKSEEELIRVLSLTP